MDLIYTDSEKKDIGVLNAQTFDLAFGKDENNFTVTLNRKEHCCDYDSLIYVENEEYGGIVDEIEVETEQNIVTYSGRTWHGILEGKMIPPKTYSGNANEVISEIINDIELGCLFQVIDELSEIEILDYKIIEFSQAYTAICTMLLEHGGKIKVRWKEKHVELSVDSYEDYGNENEFNTILTDFRMKKKKNVVNHIICTGTDEENRERIIHVFTNDYGVIQAYSATANPLQDSDYILDERNKVLGQEHEIEELCDVGSLEVRKNYILLNKKPSNWSEHCDSYFVIDVEGDEESYNNVEWETQEKYDLLKVIPSNWSADYDDYYEFDLETEEYTKVKSASVYSIQTSKPADWDSKYENYYTKENEKFKSVNGIDKYTVISSKPSNWSTQYNNYYEIERDDYGASTGNYTSVSGDTQNSYTLQTSKPSNWSEYCTAYYKKHTDGTGLVEYEGVSKDSKDYYAIQKQRPSDWESNYKDYYQKGKKGKYVTVSAVKNKAPTWKKNKYYTKKSKEIAPKWKINTYYRKKSKSIAPAWKANFYYKKEPGVIIPTWQKSKYYTKIKDTVPTWQKNKYYKKVIINIAPAWKNNTYYSEVLDHYADMIEKAIEKFEDYYNADEIDIDMTEVDVVYDINDMVSACDDITGLSTMQPITKKIVKIQNGSITINYEVG